MRKRPSIAATSVWLLIVPILMAALPAFGQTGQVYGEITGTVMDSQKSVLPGVTVTLSGPAVMGLKTTTTTERGVYNVPFLPSGTYTLKFEIEGFRTVVREGLIVATRSTVTQDVTMDVATLAEVVTVTGSSPVVDVASTATGQRLGEELLSATPTTRGVMGAVASLPGVVLGRPDIGGLQEWNVPSLYSHGQADYQISYNGTRAQDPGPNCSFYYVDFDGMAEINAQTSGMNAEVGPAGAAMNLVPKSGGNNVTGSLYFTGTRKGLAGDNVDANLQSLGVRLGTLPLRFGDYHVDSGGALLKDRVWWYGSFRDLSLTQTVVGFPLDYPAETRNLTLHPTIQVTNNNKLSFVYMYHTKIEAWRDASSTTPAIATHDYHGPMDFANANWNAVLSSRTYLEVAGGIFANLINRDPSPLWLALPVKIPPTLDLGTGIRGGEHATGPQYQNGYTSSVNAALTHYRDGWIGAGHQLKVGATLEYQWQDNTQLPYNDSEWDYTNGAPTQLIAYSSPGTGKLAMRPYAFFVQDRITYPRVTFNIGLRLADFSHAWLPEQTGGPGVWVPLKTYPRVDIPLSGWSYHPAPRLGAAFKITEDGRNVAKVSYGRYYDNLGGPNFSIINPNTFSPIATYRWFGDLNGNGTVDSNEYNPQPLSVNLANLNSISPDFKQPKVDEITLSFQRELASNFAFGATYVQRWFTDNWADVNVGIPVSAYTPVSLADSGPDNIKGTGDDTTVTMYNLNSAFLGKQAFSRQTVPGSKTYQAIELTATKRMTSGFQLSGSYVYSKDYGVILSGVLKSLADPNDPNASLASNRNGYDAQSQPHAFKVLANMNAPGGINIGVNYQIYSGAPYNRTFRATLNQGSVTIRPEEQGTYRADRENLLSIKLDRRVRLGRFRLDGFIEGHNLTNSSAGVTYGTLTQSYASTAALTAANLTNTAYFGRPTVILQPRLFKLGAKLEW